MINKEFKDFIIIEKPIICNDNINDFILLENINNSNNLNLISNEEQIMDIINLYIPVDMKDFIYQVRNGYVNNDEILIQFKKDLPRIKLYFNKLLIKNKEIFIKYILSEFENQTGYDILMLCTQAIMAYPFELIQNSINDYIGEISQNKKDKRNKLKINIKYNNKNLHFTITKKLRIFSITDNGEDYTKNMVKITIDFNLFKDKFILTKLSFE